jgi:flotillin
VAIVKVGGNADQIRLAAQRFLSQQQDVEAFTQEVLAGALRSIVGGLTVEQIIRDRAAFAQRVADESENSLTGQGLILDTFQIQDVTDDGSYLADLGRPEAARIGQAASIAEANARQAAEQARIAAEQEIAVAQRALALKQAEIKAETDAAAAQAAAAGPLAQADRDQAILLEQEKVAVRRAALTERNLETEVRKPADAARYKVEQEAEANRSAEIAAAEARKAATIAAAEARAQEARLSGEAEKAQRAALAEAEAIEGERRGEAERARRVAEAEATRAEGEAQAAATLAVGQAEAEAMDKRAEAFAHYNDAAVLQMLIEVLPQIAREVAAPIAAIDQLTVVSSEGAGALPRLVNDNVVQTLNMLKTSTGLDLQALIQNSVDKAAGARSDDQDDTDPKKA